MIDDSGPAQEKGDLPTGLQDALLGRVVVVDADLAHVAVRALAHSGRGDGPSQQATVDACLVVGPGDDPQYVSPVTWL